MSIVSLIHKYKHVLIPAAAFLVLVLPLLVLGSEHSDDGESWEPDISSIIGWPIYAICIGIGGFVAWLGGMVLDLAIQYAVLGFGESLTTNVGVVVNDLWMVIRDVLNILFIFSLIFIGLRIILNSSDTSTRKQIGYLIIAALLINFSLFITKAIVDFSNIAAYQIYTQITRNHIATSGTDPSAYSSTDPIGSLNAPGQSISGNFMQHFRLTTFANIDLSQATTGDNFWVNLGKIVVLSVGMMFFMIVAGFVFFAGGFLLIARFVALVIFMIFSPLMFVGWIFPGFKTYQDQWWSRFIREAFVAPAYLFMLLLALLIMEGTNFAGGRNGQFSDVFNNGGNIDPTTVGLILYYFLGIFFLYAAVLVAKQMSAVGASGALKIANVGKNFVTGTAPSFVYRNTAGWGLSKAVKGMDAIDRSLAESEARDGERSRLSRNVRRFTGVNMMRSVGRMAAGDKTTRGAVEEASNLGIGGGRGRAQVQKDLAEQNVRASRGNEASDLRAKIAATQVPNPTDENILQLESALAKADKSTLEELANSSGGMALVKHVSGNIDNKTFEKLMESDNLDAGQKASIAAARNDSVTNTISRAGGGNFAKGLRGASADQIDALDFKKLVESDDIINIQAGQIDKLESKWGAEKMRIFKDSRKAKIINKLQTGSMNEILNTRKSEKEVAKLPNEVFTDHLAEFVNLTVNGGSEIPMSASLLQNIGSESGLNGAQKKEVGRMIRSLYSTPGSGAPDELPRDIEQFFRSPAGASFNT